MHDVRTAVVALGTALLFAAWAAGPAHAEVKRDVGKRTVATVEADAGIGAQLKELGYKFDIDEDGDYKLVMQLDADRTHVVFVRSPVHEYMAHAIREIWAPAYGVDGGRFPAPIYERLLKDSHEKVLGGWVQQGDYALFVVKLAANASTTQLEQAIFAAASTADEMEAELAPGTDDY